MRHDGKPAPRDGSLPEVIGEQLREVVEEEVPARALMAAYRLPEDGTRAADAADVALTILGGGESSRLYNRLVRRDRTAVAAGFDRGESHIQDVPSAVLKPLVTAGKITATVDAKRLAECDTVSICVPTPLNKTKDPELSYVVAASRAVRETL